MTTRFFKMMLTAIMLLLSAMFYGCAEDEKQQNVATAMSVDTVQPDQITSDAHIYLYSGGYKTTDLRADEIIQFTQLDSMIATNVESDFFDSTGERISTLTSESGYIRENDNFLSVTGNVIVIGEDSIRIETEYLEWDAANDRVDTDSFVTVIRHGDTLRSYGVITDPWLRDITFKRKVSGRKELTGNEEGLK
ncbi:MAG: LPS export ABC transporter periplasmic protein LptC [FCB group bacterium]|nr:LPS export ABC transporter periplasmic protein LptC [FCB group bacterium]